MLINTWLVLINTRSNKKMIFPHNSMVVLKNTCELLVTHINWLKYQEESTAVRFDGMLPPLLVNIPSHISRRSSPCFVQFPSTERKQTHSLHVGCAVLSSGPQADQPLRRSRRICSDSPCESWQATSPCEDRLGLLFWCYRHLGSRRCTCLCQTCKYVLNTTCFARTAQGNCHRGQT